MGESVESKVDPSWGKNKCKYKCPECGRGSLGPVMFKHPPSHDYLVDQVAALGHDWTKIGTGKDNVQRGFMMKKQFVIKHGITDKDGFCLSFKNKQEAILA